MHFKAQGFVGQVKSLLKSGEDALEMLIDAYLWANQHLKEIHCISPEYEQQWLKSEMRRIFNVDPTVFVTTAKKLGGGSKPEQFAAGKEIIRKVGVFEAFRAEKLLSTEQMAMIRLDLPKQAGVEDFRKLVDQHAKKLERLKSESSEKTFGDLLKENLRLKKENERLQAENERLKKKLSEMQEVLAA